MRNTSWDRIIPGEIVNFIYKSKGQTKGTRRWVICMDPKYIYRKKSGRTANYFVGIQIDQMGAPRIPQPVIKEIITMLGGVAKKQSGGRQIEMAGISTDDRPRDVATGEFNKVYLKIKHIIKRESVFRTYNLRECKKRRVFLEDKYDYIPKENIKQFITEVQLDTEVVINE